MSIQRTKRHIKKNKFHGAKRNNFRGAYCYKSKYNMKFIRNKII